MNDLTHIGVIMDGNRRWAKKNNCGTVLSGHEQGVEKFMELCTWCLNKEIPYLTVYAFSTENWNRSRYEIDGLFMIFEKFFRDRLGDCLERGIRIKTIGDKGRLKEKHREIIRQAEKKTENCGKLLVQVCLSYGGRDEIARAARKIAGSVLRGGLKEDSVTEETVEKNLDTAGTPMLDAIIRTGGNHRLSNFLIWQAAYAEIYFTDTLWPDFTESEFERILEEYRRTQINMGR